MGPVAPVAGLGMAGPSHWSVTVRCVQQQIEFDVACRLQGFGGPLGSQYVLAHVQPLVSQEDALLLASDRHPIRLSVVAPPAPHSAAQIQLVGSLLTISPPTAPPLTGSHTIRWSYAIQSIDRAS